MKPNFPLDMKKQWEVEEKRLGELMAKEEEGNFFYSQFLVILLLLPTSVKQCFFRI